ncbi:MAG: hypothetical protein U5K00_06200 [Melioribacteraceae bacterium]|nr:hypothetical protein [Melioribacteraceae bacterium]
MQKSIQKKILFFTVLIVLLSIVIWVIDGMEFITTTQKVLTDNSIENRNDSVIIEEKFIWGLDLTLLVSGITLITGGFLFRKYDKQKD